MLYGLGVKEGSQSPSRLKNCRKEEDMAAKKELAQKRFTLLQVGVKLVKYYRKAIAHTLDFTELV